MPRARGSPLPRAFYARASLEVARDVLGRTLVRTLPEGRRLAGRVVEAEAYREDDPASHSYRGRTSRTDVMFGPPGRLYVYFTYGMHYCMNLVTGCDGEGSAVLLRAVEPLEDLEAMAERRGLSSPRLLCSGPGRLCQAFAVDRAQNGTDLVRGAELRLEAGEPVTDDLVLSGPRIGVTVATHQPWRFVVAGSPYLSRASFPEAAPARRAGRGDLRGSPRS